MSPKTKGLFREFLRDSGGLPENAERVMESGEALPPPRPVGEFREFLLENGGLSAEERLAIETNDARAMETLKEGWDAGDRELADEWRLDERAKH